MRGVRPFPAPHAVLLAKFGSQIDRLGSMFTLRSGEHDRGRKTLLRSRALFVRAKGEHEPWSPGWIEAEAAKLIYRAVIIDNHGERSLLKWEGRDPWFQEEEILRRAKRLVPSRLAELTAH